MDRAVVYTILAAALFLFIIFSPPRNHIGYSPNHNGPSRLILHRRLGYKFPIPKFDPLILKLERFAAEKGLGDKEGDSTYSRHQHSDHPRTMQVNDKEKEFFYGNGRLNITLRLLVLFPLVDTYPKDGKVSFEELERWNINRAKDGLYYRTQKEMESRDKDGDGAISFEEFLPQFSPTDIAKNEKGHGEAGWWMEQFTNADVDHNGTLHFEEFNNLLHPEECDDKVIQMWLLREKIKRMDDDKDGKLNQDEFSKYAYPAYNSYAEFENATSTQVPSQEQKFYDLDLNKDRMLDVRELIPMLGYLKPGELSYAKYYTGFLMHESDENGDGFLTIEEMLEHEQKFYDTVYGDNQDNDDYYHDEL